MLHNALKSAVDRYFNLHIINLQARGHPFMTFTKKSRFWPPCPHASTWAGPPLWTSTHGRH